jgi:hypothetical protein
MVGCSSTSRSAAVAPVNSDTHRVSTESLSACKSARQAAEPDLLKIPGIVSVGIGISDSEAGQATVEVYSSIEPSDIRKKLPATFQCVPIKIIRTGTIHAL